jgi:hypothetical protein
MLIVAVYSENHELNREVNAIGKIKNFARLKRMVRIVTTVL